MSRHALAEERSLAYHRVIAGRLASDPDLLLRARQTVAAWSSSGAVHRAYSEAWAELLQRPADAIAAFLVDEGERARELRQVTPFAGAIDARERWAIWRATRAAS